MGRIKLESQHGIISRTRKILNDMFTEIYSGVVLEDTRWDDKTISIGGMVLDGSNPPTVGTFVGSVSVLMFSNTVDNIVYLTLQLPHSYKEGTDVVPHIHWAPMNTNTGSVTWKMEYQWKNIGEAFSGSTTTVAVTQAASGTTGEQMVASFGAIDGTGKGISSMFCARIYRDVDDGDDYNANAAMLEFDIHFEKDTIGSDQEYIK